MTPEEREFQKTRGRGEIERQVVKILREVPSHEERGVEVAIVRYYSAGRVFAPQLVFQEIYTDRVTKQRKHGKLKGLKWGDFKFITQPNIAEEIIDLLADLSTREKPARRSGQDAAANDTREEAPSQAPNPSDDDEVHF